MQTMTPQTDREIADYFNAQETAAINEMEILGTVVAEILRAGQPITNKAIIAAYSATGAGKRRSNARYLPSRSGAGGP